MALAATTRRGARGRSHVEPYNPAVRTMQQRMKRAGIDPGPIDGLKGPLTRRGMRAYERRFGRSPAEGATAAPAGPERMGRTGARASSGRIAPDERVAGAPGGRASDLDLAPADKAPADDAPADQAPAAGAAGDLALGAVKDGHSLPATAGKATTFWNGHYTYKGKRDTANMSQGAWGDPNKPTEYFAALPVGLKGGGNWWHNQKLLITNPRNGRQVVVRVQDKGPHPSTGAAIDLSPVAKEALGVGFMDNMNVKIAFARDDAPVGPAR